MWRAGVDMGVFVLATLSAGVFYCAAQRELVGGWRSTVKYLPMMMALGVGLCLSNTQGAAGGVPEATRASSSGRPSTADHRAPGVVEPAARSRAKKDWLPYVEMLYGVYMLVCTVISAVDLRSAVLTPFLAIFTFGFFYVSVSSLLAQRVAARPVAEAAKAAGRRTTDPARDAGRAAGSECGRNSVVECQLPKLDVEGSNPFARCRLGAAKRTRSGTLPDPSRSAYWHNYEAMGESS